MGAARWRRRTRGLGQRLARATCTSAGALIAAGSQGLDCGRQHGGDVRRAPRPLDYAALHVRVAQRSRPPPPVPAAPDPVRLAKRATRRPIMVKVIWSKSTGQIQLVKANWSKSSDQSLLVGVGLRIERLEHPRGPRPAAVPQRRPGRCPRRPADPACTSRGIPHPHVTRRRLAGRFTHRPRPEATRRSRGEGTCAHPCTHRVH